LEWLKYILKPKPETLEKLLLVRGLLKSGLPAYKAVKKAKLGWKNYYKYAPFIYDDPEILVSLPKGFLGDYAYRGFAVDELRMVLDEVAKHEAEKLIRRVLRRGEPEEAKENPGKAWLQLCKDLQIKWIHELWLSSL